MNLSLGDYALAPKTYDDMVGGLCRLAELVEHGGVRFTKLEFPEQPYTRHLAPGELASLRPVIDRAEAAALLAAFDHPAPARPWSPERYVRARSTLDRGTLAEIQAELAGLYMTSPTTFAVVSMIGTFEQHLLPILAHVLGVPYKRIVEQLRAEKPAFGPIAPIRSTPESRPSAVPPIRGYEALATFTSGGALAFGQRADHRDKMTILHVAPGRWNAYWTEYIESPYADEDNELVRFLLLVHADAPDDLNDWQIAGEIPKLTRGGNITVIDLAALDDRAIVDRVLYLGGTNGYGDRALCVVAASFDSRPIMTSGAPVQRIKIPLGDPRDV